MSKLEQEHLEKEQTMSDFPVKSGQTFLMIGDSITDCGRTGPEGPYGCGYVRFFMDLVAKNHPERNIHWINEGIGGNTVHNLRARWQEDVIDQEPDWLSIMIGINDCHGRIGDPEEDAIDAFRSDYVFILEQARSVSARLVLLDPFYVAMIDGEERVANEKRILARLGAYLDVVEELAREYDAVHVRTQQMFADQLAYRAPAYFGPEPVHPYPTGHLMMAMELYRVLCS